MFDACSFEARLANDLLLAIFQNIAISGLRLCSKIQALGH